MGQEGGILHEMKVAKDFCEQRLKEVRAGAMQTSGIEMETVHSMMT